MTDREIELERKVASLEYENAALKRSIDAIKSGDKAIMDAMKGYHDSIMSRLWDMMMKK